MDDFIFDTSGAVQQPRTWMTPDLAAAWPKHCGAFLEFVRWEDLDPFTQGYVEALFASLQPTFGQPRYQVLREPNNGGWSIRDWGTNDTVLIHSLKRSAEKHARGLEREETARRDRGVGFSDLAPETLAEILKDCEAFPKWNVHTHTGESFWRLRQQGHFKMFPPLNITLSDDGKVYLREGAAHAKA